MNEKSWYLNVSEMHKNTQAFTYYTGKMFKFQFKPMKNSELLCNSSTFLSLMRGQDKFLG